MSERASTSGTDHLAVEWHRLNDAVAAVGEAYVNAIQSIFPPHHQDHWEMVVHKFTQEHAHVAPTGP
jgi:hypothetical protein